MISLERIQDLAVYENSNQKLELVYKGWEEPHSGCMLVYYSVLIHTIDRTKAIFSSETIQCHVNEKIETEHPTKDFVFIPALDLFLVNILDFTKTRLNVYFRENGNTFTDGLTGSFFYENKHLTINNRSLILTDLSTLEVKKIKFENGISIEWAVLMNDNQILVIEAFSNVYFIYDLKEQKIIKRANMVDESLYPNIFRWIYRGQKYNSNQFQMELVEKKDGQFFSHYFKIY